ncbi:Pentatricopeptide repeat-containing protein, partial [Cucurbita argyrosperma subsp. sororia]
MGSASNPPQRRDELRRLWPLHPARTGFLFVRLGNCFALVLFYVLSLPRISSDRRSSPSNQNLAALEMPTMCSCGSLDYVWELFEEMPEKDEVTLRDDIGLHEQPINSTCRYILSNAVGWLQTEYYDTCERSSHLLTFCNTKDGARLVCDQFKGRSLIIWTAIISAYAANGGANVALSFFYEILTNGIRPDSVAFTPVCSCAHSGELDEAWKIFNVLLPEYGIQPLIEHYACMVGVLSLAEKFSDAVDFISKMPIEPTTKVWDALLNGASVAGDVELGKCVFDSLLDTEPENTGNNIIMDNLYSLFGRWKKSG